MNAVNLRRSGRGVLHDVTVSFPRNMVSAVVGPSGAGKTSLLRCLNRLEDPHNGQVSLDGVNLDSIKPTELRRRVGMIFQTPVLFEGGVRANLTYGLAHCTDDEMLSALKSADLPGEVLEGGSTTLSVGQAQRVCIARALVRRPEVLLMDEPTSALDKDAVARIEELVRSLSEGGLTVVLVTHNLDQALRVADFAVLLVDGRVRATGTPQQVTTAWPARTQRD